MVANRRPRRIRGLGPGQGVGHVLPVEHPVRAIDDRAEPVQPGRMAEHVTDRDPRLAVLGELGPVGGDRLVVIDQPAIGEHVGGGGHHALGRAEAHRERVARPWCAPVVALAAPEIHDEFAVVDRPRATHRRRWWRSGARRSPRHGRSRHGRCPGSCPSSAPTRRATPARVTHVVHSFPSATTASRPSRTPPTSRSTSLTAAVSMCSPTCAVLRYDSNVALVAVPIDGPKP